MCARNRELHIRVSGSVGWLSEVRVSFPCTGVVVLFSRQRELLIQEAIVIIESTSWMPRRSTTEPVSI